MTGSILGTALLQLPIGQTGLTPTARPSPVSSIGPIVAAGGTLSPTSIRTGTVSLNLAPDGPLTARSRTLSGISGTMTMESPGSQQLPLRARARTVEFATEALSPTANYADPTRSRINSGYSVESQQIASPTAGRRRGQTIALTNLGGFDQGAMSPTAQFRKERPRAQTMALGGPIPSPFGMPSPPVQSSEAAYSGSLPLFRGQPYKPGPRSVLVIGPGGGTRMNAQAYQVLQQSGWDLTFAQAQDHDRSPAYQDFLYPPGWENGTPDLSMNGGRNLATVADNVIAPMIEQMIAAGRGPAAIICGSRGGQVTLPRLWSTGLWIGPVLCVNGGCIKSGRIPTSPCRLILITGGQDFFETKDPRATAQQLQKEDPSQPVLLYHDQKEGHMPGSMGDVFGPLLEIAINEEMFASTAQGAAQGQFFLPQPQARRHNVPIRAL